MFDRETENTPRSRVPLLCLDYGADEQPCEAGLTISERGMRFISRWQFSIGTQLAVSCVYDRPGHGPERVKLEGTVVWCEPLEAAREKAYESTLLFLELPDELKEGLREFSHQLETGF
jgi:hypothetical protein